MLRQFSVRRIVGFFLFDCLGTLAMLFCAAIVRARLWQLPSFVADFVGSTEVQASGISGVSGISGADLPWPVFVAVLIIWPVSLFIFSVYDGHRNGTIWQELKNVFFAI